MKKIFLLSIIGILGVVLSSCSSKEQVLIYASTEEERIAQLDSDLSAKFPQYNIIIQYVGTGELVTRLMGEGTNTECDIFYDLESTNAEILRQNNPNLFADLSNYDFSIYDDSVIEYTVNHKDFIPELKTAGAIIYNKDVLARNNLSVPTTYEELLDLKYKGLISMPNPKSSGTGYMFYNGLASLDGLDDSYDYFTKLSANVKEFTSSGSAPMKAVERGETAIGFGMLWQIVGYCNTNKNLGFTFLDKGAPFNLYTMGIINGKQERTAVKEIFDFFYTEQNQKMTTKFTPDKIYKNQVETEIPNYPTSVSEITMNGLFDPSYKQNLLDKWKI